MAKDELESITEDKWDEDIWGIEHVDSDSKVEIPKLVFYFGKQVSCQDRPIPNNAHVAQDHWVSNHVRDELIAARGQGEGEISNSKPLMMIDDNGVPHSFCIGKFVQIGPYPSLISSRAQRTDRRKGETVDSRCHRKSIRCLIGPNCRNIWYRTLNIFA